MSFPSREFFPDFIDDVVESSFVSPICDDGHSQILIETIGVVHSYLIFDEGDVFGFCMSREKDFGFDWVNFLAKTGKEFAENLLNGEAVLLCGFCQKE